MEYSKTGDDSLALLRKKVLIFMGTTIFFLILSVVLLILLLTRSKGSSQWDIIPSESIIPVTTEIAVNGIIASESAAFYQRKADVSKSKYYPIINFYDGKVTDTLQILPKFKTYQQSSPYSCGDASALMALRYFGINDITEDMLYKEATTKEHGTATLDLANALKKLTNSKVSIEYKKDDAEIILEKFVAMVKECTNPKNNCVLLLESVEWGGHWMTLIGYDSMGTIETADDVLIFADPFDTTDHNQDGYYIVSLERYHATWYDHNVLEKGHSVSQYVKISKKEIVENLN